MFFDLQPVLKGELLELRPLRAEDFHDLYAVAADPLIDLGRASSDFGVDKLRGIRPACIAPEHALYWYFPLFLTTGVRT
jgi:hypothetical protein